MFTLRRPGFQNRILACFYLRGILRTEENRKLVFLLPSIAFNEQNVNVKFIKTQKKEKQKKNTVARKNWLATRGLWLRLAGSHISYTPLKSGSVNGQIFDCAC